MEAMEVPKPYVGPWRSPNLVNCIGFGVMEVPKPYEFIGFGELFLTPIFRCPGRVPGNHARRRGASLPACWHAGPSLAQNLESGSKQKQHNSQLRPVFGRTWPPNRFWIDSARLAVQVAPKINPADHF